MQDQRPVAAAAPPDGMRAIVLTHDAVALFSIETRQAAIHHMSSS